MPTNNRCAWCAGDALYEAYHDSEWGVPLWDDQKLFEFLILEGAQAGLSWITILRKREGYREVFDNFEPERLARWSDGKLEAALTDSRIVRNRLKVYAVRRNALAWLRVQAEEPSVAEYLWAFVEGQPQQNTWTGLGDLPATTSTSQAMSKALKKRGFTFVGPTIIYAFMQATGMVNDHVRGCFRHAECAQLAGRKPS